MKTLTLFVHARLLICFHIHPKQKLFFFFFNDMTTNEMSMWSFCMCIHIGDLGLVSSEGSKVSLIQSCPEHLHLCKFQVRVLRLFVKCRVLGSSILSDAWWWRSGQHHYTTFLSSLSSVCTSYQHTSLSPLVWENGDRWQNVLHWSMKSTVCM